jgi:CheY-like chemotaxis protein
VVDDERDIRTAVAEILTDEGYEVLDASDGAEALDKVRAFRPQLILLDLMMPGMNGWEFRAAQQGDPDPAVAKVPVIVLSALGKTGNVEAEGYLRKPFDLDELLTAVKRHAA